MATKLFIHLKIPFVCYGNRKFKLNYVFSLLYIFFKKHFLSNYQLLFG